MFVGVVIRRVVLVESYKTSEAVFLKRYKIVPTVHDDSRSPSCDVVVGNEERERGAHVRNGPASVATWVPREANSNPNSNFPLDPPNHQRPQVRLADPRALRGNR